MNEEHEQGQLSGLPEDILDERNELDYVVPPIQRGVTNGHEASVGVMQKSQALKNDAALITDTDPPHYDLDVQSTFDSRPVNAVDILFGDVISIRIPA